MFRHGQQVVRRFAPILVILLSLPAISRAGNNDAPDLVDEQLWLEVAARVELVDSLRLTLAQMLRLDQGMSHIEEAMPELAFSYRPLSGFRVDLGYRFTADRRDEGDWRYEHRVFINARYDRDVGPIELSYRLGFQEDLLEKRGEKLNESVLRQRVGATLEVHDIVKPFVTGELLINVGGDVETGLRNWRLTAGTVLNFGDHQPELFYRLIRTFDSPIETDHIIGLGYRYDF